MKIVLFTLNGSWSHTSLALRCLRAPLEREGFAVSLVEHSLRDRTSHVLEHLYREDADVYGFSCYIWNLSPMLELAETLHRLLPHAKIVLGGPEVSFATERFDAMDWIDAIVTGEGEEALPRLCRAFAEGQAYSRIMAGGLPQVMGNEGILYRDGEETGGILYYESSRGCPYSCAYCLSSATQGVRRKSVEQTVADLEAFERLKVDCKVIKFVDRTFNFDPKRANAIWRELLDDRFTKCYHFEICASLLDEDSFSCLSRFPKEKVQLEIGLQSTNRETLAAVARQIDPDRVLQNVRRLHDMGNIHVHLDLIAGLPYESYDRFAQSFDDAYGCADLLQLGFLKLLHGTPLCDRSEEYGYRTLPTPPYTVLESRWISYPQMQKLSRIAETLERFVESRRFSRTLDYLNPYMQSPFRFFEGLTDFITETDRRPLQKISQPDVYLYLLRYAGNVVRGIDEERLKMVLGEDFSEHEHKNPPYFLR